MLCLKWNITAMDGAKKVESTLIHSNMIGLTLETPH